MTIHNTHITKRVATLAMALMVALSAMSADVVIKMKRKSGVYTIPCEVNGLKRDFIFDTGAAKTSLSQELVNELLARRLISQKDFTGTTQTRNASGVIDNNATIVLRQLKVGNRVMHNVQAIVAVAQKAPLLLGLNAIDLLGEWSMRRGYFILHGDAVEFADNDTETTNNNNIYSYQDNTQDGTFIDSEEQTQQGYIDGNATLGPDRLRAYRGDANAQYALGMSYLEGRGVDADPKIAVVWLRMAAMQGHHQAQLALAQCYENGWGVDTDPEQAIYWRFKSQEE